MRKKTMTRKKKKKEEEIEGKSKIIIQKTLNEL